MTGSRLSGYPVLPLLFACVDPVGDVAGTVAGQMILRPEVTQAAATPVHRVRWTTSEPSSGRVTYGVDALDRVVGDDVVATEHDVFVAGIAAGEPWYLQAVSQVGDDTLTSPVFSISETSAPPDLPIPTLTVPPGDEIGGFTLLPMDTPHASYVIILDRMGLPVWWRPAQAQATYRAQYEPQGPAVTWVETDPDSGEQTFVTSTLDGVETRVPAPLEAHHDFVKLPEGGFVTLVYVDHVIDGITVRTDSLQEVLPDGSVLELWNSFDTFDWNGDGTVGEDSRVAWPHANSLSYDAERRKLLVSFYFLDTVGQIDRDTGNLDWLLGGQLSDWTVAGAGFDSQHGPLSFDGGQGLTLLNNGPPDSGSTAAVAMRYALDHDAMVATPTWTFDHDAAYTGVLLGNVDWLADDTALVNWGTAGVLDRVNEAGEVRWSVAFRLGTFTMFSQHLSEFAGATR